MGPSVMSSCVTAPPAQAPRVFIRELPMAVPLHTPWRGLFHPKSISPGFKKCLGDMISFKRGVIRGYALLTIFDTSNNTFLSQHAYINMYSLSYHGMFK